MPPFICTTCGTQFAEAADGRRPPASCLICDDERQFLGPSGQQWTTSEELRRTHWNTVRQLESSAERHRSLTGIGIAPQFGIGQRALLIASPNGNILWDCVPLLDPGLASLIQSMGGIKAIAISHPHYYANMVEWSREFSCPIYLHAADRQWVMRPDPCLEFWDGEERSLDTGLTLHRLGGHFAGGTVLHWETAADGKGALLSGDIVQAVLDRGWVSFMYSYPNYIPLPAKEVQRIAGRLESLRFDRLYGAFWPGIIPEDAHDAVQRSAERYLAALERIPGSNNGAP